MLIHAKRKVSSEIGQRKQTHESVLSQSKPRTSNEEERQGSATQIRQAEENLTENK